MKSRKPISNLVDTVTTKNIAYPPNAGLKHPWRRSFSPHGWLTTKQLKAVEALREKKVKR